MSEALRLADVLAVYVDSNSDFGKPPQNLAASAAIAKAEASNGQ